MGSYVHVHSAVAFLEFHRQQPHARSLRITSWYWSATGVFIIEVVKNSSSGYPRGAFDLHGTVSELLVPHA